MNTHGHITPNADGTKARCGGPQICIVCNKEWHALSLAERTRLAGRFGTPPVLIETPTSFDGERIFVGVEKLHNGQLMQVGSYISLVDYTSASLYNKAVWLTNAVTDAETKIDSGEMDGQQPIPV